ncbi:MAG: indolepyruvate decarboxylase [Thermoproteota archaeon]|nr:indolepyruvate decarboxylase [Thermoproteota archaeon]
MMMMEAKLTIGKYLLQALKEVGVKQVFGIPGDMVIKFFKMIEDDKDIDLCTFSHEPGVGFAAIGSSRATHRPAATCITYGAGGLNMVNSVACAYAEKTPLIVISGGPGQAEKQRDVFLHHVVKDFDSQLKAYTEVTQEAVVLDSVDTAYTKIKRTLSACQEYMRPVYIEIPRDMVDQEILIPKDNKEICYVTDESALKEAVNEILLRIVSSKMPVILVGVEVDRLYLKEYISKLAEKLNIPVVSEFLARDIIPVDDPYYFGTYLGLAGNQVAKKLVEESDCLLMFGVIVADINLGIKLERLKRENLILCFSRQVFMGHHIYNEVPLKPLIEELLQREADKKKLPFPAKIKPVINRTCKYIDRAINMSEVIDALNWFFSEFGEMPIISDTGDCLFITTKIETSTIMASAYYSTMGFGAPAAIGYAITTGKRPIVLIGDGAFQMTGQEICHCPRFGINPIFIVFNNRRWGMQQLFYPTAHFNELDNWPYAEIARLWGGKGYVCDTCETLYRALEEAKNNKEFSLIELQMSKEEYSEEIQAWFKELVT